MFILKTGEEMAAKNAKKRKEEGWWGARWRGTGRRGRVSGWKGAEIGKPRMDTDEHGRKRISSVAVPME